MLRAFSALATWVPRAFCKVLEQQISFSKISPLKIRGVRGVMKERFSMIWGYYSHNPLYPPYLKGDKERLYLKGEIKGEDLYFKG
jgi:hypothetical protein